MRQKYGRIWQGGMMRRWLFTVALACGLASTARAASVGIVTTLTGNLAIRRHGGPSPAALSKGGAFDVGDVLSTAAGAKATLLFNDGSQVKLNANTTIQISAPNAGGGDQTLFRAITGEAWARLRQGRAVQTRSAIAGVRGTEISIKVDDDGTTTLAVLEGQVHFYNEFGAVEVGEAQQSVARVGSAPTAPVTIGNSSLIVEWTLDLSRAAIPRERFFVTLDRAALQPELAQRLRRAQAAPQDAAAVLDAGDALFDNHQFDAALERYEAARQLAPADPRTPTRIGYTLLELDRLDEADKVFRGLIGPRTDGVIVPAASTGRVLPEPIGSEPGAEARPRARAAFAPAVIGLAWVMLTHDEPERAQALAERALSRPGEAAVQTMAATGAGADDENLVQARIALGVALMRQPGRGPEAIEVLRAAADSEQRSRYRYQAHAWLALLAQEQGDGALALREASLAAELEPHSALAHGNLALVYFYNNRPLEAVREAKLATTLEPTSVVAQLTLGQAQLARGDVDAAATTAARAIALDERLPQGHYLLGLADAQRRDYTHAVRRLRQTLRLAPTFLPAAQLLARVYTRMGRNQEAVELLQNLEPRYPNSHEVRAALGEVYYEQARYNDAINSYRSAIGRRPTSALYYSGLARTLLDANRLSEAIDAAQQSVTLAPEVAQYHALLGQAYDFSRLSSRAEREYREAIALDPANALARALLALQALRAGDPTTTVDTFSQAFLYDPAISRQLMRGGISTELTPSTGNDGQQTYFGLQRATLADGRLNYMGGELRGGDEGDHRRINDDTRASFFKQNATYLLRPPTNLYVDFTRARGHQGLPSLATSPFGSDPDASQSLRFDQAVVAIRHRMPSGNALWLGLTYQRLRIALDNPSSPFTLPFPAPIGFAFPFSAEYASTQALIPEARYDITLSDNPVRPRVLTFGAAYARRSPLTRTGQLALLDPPNAPQVFPASSREERDRFTMGYVQLAQRMNERVSFVAQLRAQRDARTITRSGGPVPAGTSVTTETTESHLLPGISASLQASRDTSFRLLYNRSANSTNLALAPTETRLVVEPDILSHGVPSTSHTLELDVEQRLPHRAFAKLFLFRAIATDLAMGVDANVYAFRVAGGAFALNRFEQVGAGLRYEVPLSHHLYGQASLLFNRTRNRAPGQLFDGQTAPYYPDRAASLALNYVGRTGIKTMLIANYYGPFYQDRPDLFGLAAPATRPQFGSQTYISLLIAKEPSVNYELFAGVTNIFNRPAVMFNDVPALMSAFGANRRRLLFGVTRRM